MSRKAEQIRNKKMNLFFCYGRVVVGVKTSALSNSDVVAYEGKKGIQKTATLKNEKRKHLKRKKKRIIFLLRFVFEVHK